MAVDPFDWDNGEVLPGVDYKGKLPSCRRPGFKSRLDLETRYLSTVKREISRPEVLRNVQNAFQETASGSELGSKMICLTTRDISTTFSSPLSRTSVPCFITKHKLDDMVVQELRSLEAVNVDGDEVKDSSAVKHTRPTVLVVDPCWKNGIVVKQIHYHTTKSYQLEALLKRTPLRFECKTRFNSVLRSRCDELFPDWRENFMILDGSGGGGISGSSVAYSCNLLLQDDPSPPYIPQGDPFTRNWTEYTDVTEHKMLVIPDYSRRGLNTELKTFQLVYHAKFVVGRRVYQHRFLLQVRLAKRPQHFGLIFTFAEDSLGHSKLRIKSLLTVYSVFPVKNDYALLVTYPGAEGNFPAPEKDRLRGSSGLKRVVNGTVDLLTESLSERNLLACKWNHSFYIDRNISSPIYFYWTGGGSCFGEESKHLKKHLMQREIVWEERWLREICYDLNSLNC